MIKRENWEDVNSFLEYSKIIKQSEDNTLRRVRSFLRHLLNWADDTSFTKAKDITPSFPVYLQKARNDGKNIPLSPVSMKKACEYARLFFEYMRREHPGRYKAILPSWIESIKPAKAKGINSEVKVHEYYSQEDMLKIAAFVPDGIVQERDQAAMCFLFLSGMRVDAFVSLPVSCVDIARGYVQQLPGMGVRTKNRKAAITSLLAIPELTKVVKAWDEKIRGNYPDDCMWYAAIDRGSDAIVYKNQASEGRRIRLDKGMKKICEIAGVRYLSPHKLRHGHAVFSLKRVKDMAGLKAVSQNMMHASVSITDGIYGIMRNDDVHDIVHSIGVDKELQPNNTQDDIDKAIKLFNLLKAAGLESMLNTP